MRVPRGKKSETEYFYYNVRHHDKIRQSLKGK